MNKITNISFKGYVPVRFYIKNSKNGNYNPVLNTKNARKCNGYLVRNLNKTLKNVNGDFVKYYESYDSDYSKNPIIHSIYSKDTPDIYLVSGDDAEYISNLGKKNRKSKRTIN